VKVVASIDDEQVKGFVKLCLSMDPSKRPTCQALLSHAWLNGQSLDFTLHHAKPFLLSQALALRPLSSGINGERFGWISKTQLMHFYRLAGGNLDVELKRHSVHRSTPAIERIPCFVSLEGEELGSHFDRAHLYSDQFFFLSLASLADKLRAADDFTFKDVMFRSEVSLPAPLFVSRPFLPFATQYTKGNTSAPKILSLAEKDASLAYQYTKVTHFNQLLCCYPSSKDEILDQSLAGIPSVMRGKVWAALLGVDGDYTAFYDTILKEQEDSIDRQIEVDIPRCHQYHQLLCTPMAHLRMKRVLKAWLAVNPDYVYWQGLDSICAAFVALNFSDEALAFHSFNHFVKNMLPSNFCKNNTEAMAAKIKVFLCLMACHLPKLYKHLRQNSFFPELYAIPWFLTNFAHIFTLEQLYYLFDYTILTGLNASGSSGNSTEHIDTNSARGSTFPMFFALSIMHQHRDTLLQQTFDDCIHFFSEPFNLPFEKCLEYAIHMYHTTPPCIYSLSASPLHQSMDHIHPRDAEPSCLTLEEFLKLYPTYCTVTDLRLEEQYCHCHIGGSTWLSLDDPDLNISVLFESTSEAKSVHVFVVNKPETSDFLSNLFDIFIQNEVHGICFLVWDQDAMSKYSSQLMLYQASEESSEPVDSQLSQEASTLSVDPSSVYLSLKSQEGSENHITHKDLNESTIAAPVNLASTVSSSVEDLQPHEMMEKPLPPSEDSTASPKSKKKKKKKKKKKASSVQELPSTESTTPSS
jgi:hypothetical protein